MEPNARTATQLDLTVAHAGSTAEAEARVDKLDRVQRAIAAGVYLTHDKLEATAEALIHVLNTDEAPQRRVG